MSTHARESKTVMDSGFRLLDSRSFSGLGFQIPVVSKMPDSYSCIPEWKAQDSGFHKQKISKIPDTTCKNSPDSFTCGEYMRPASLACAFWYHQLCYILNTGLSIIIWVTGWMQTILLRKAKWTSTLSWQGIQCTESKMPELSADLYAIYAIFMLYMGLSSFKCNKFSIWIFWSRPERTKKRSFLMLAWTWSRKEEKWTIDNVGPLND